MMTNDRYLSTTLTVKEVSALGGVVNVFYLEHPGSSTALNALLAYREMCRQVDHDPEPGMQAARAAFGSMGSRPSRRRVPPVHPTRGVYVPVPHAAEVNADDRGFGKCPHCTSPRITRCQSCHVNEIDRDEAEAAGWRMDHVYGVGCIPMCDECR